MCGRNSEISSPELPRGLNSRHGGKSLFFATARRVLKEPNDSGIGSPANRTRSGFGSKRSTWLGPPDINRKITRSARGRTWGGLAEKALAAKALCRSSNEVRATHPKPAPACRRNCRREVVQDGNPYGPGHFIWVYGVYTNSLTLNRALHNSVNGDWVRNSRAIWNSAEVGARPR